MSAVHGTYKKMPKGEKNHGWFAGIQLVLVNQRSVASAEDSSHLFISYCMQLSQYLIAYRVVEPYKNLKVMEDHALLPAQTSVI